MYACMYICMYVCLYGCMYVHCMYVCMYVFMYVFMKVCMYMSVYTYRYIHTPVPVCRVSGSMPHGMLPDTLHEPWKSYHPCLISNPESTPG